MKAVLSNFGTTGDIRPFLALGTELARAGHDVVFALSPQHCEYIRKFGFGFNSIGRDLTEVQDEINHAWIAKASLSALQDVFLPLRQALPDVFEDLRTACVGCDVLVAG